MLDEVDVEVDLGTEIHPPEGDAETMPLTTRLRDATFSCTFTPRTNDLRRRWLTLGTSKFGDPIAAVIVPRKDEEQGFVFLLPRFEDPAPILRELLEELLPSLTPRLFPDAEGATGWTRRPEYELPEVLTLTNEIEVIKQETQRRVQELEERVASERHQHGWLHELLTGTDTDLVDAVKCALQTLGFQDVRDADHETPAGMPLREDLQVHDRSPLLLVEIKGIGGLPKEAASLQVTKYLVPRMKQLKRTDVSGLAIINHQRRLAPLERTNRPFQDDVLINAEAQEFGVMTAFDLFRLVRGARDHGWPPEVVMPIFYRTGRIEAVPAHYELIGVIDNYFEQPDVVAIQLDDGQVLARGDRLAYDLPVGWVEEVADSVQIDRADIDSSPAGAHVAIKSTLGKARARKGVRVYRAGDSTPGAAQSMVG